MLAERAFEGLPKITIELPQTERAYMLVRPRPDETLWQLEARLANRYDRIKTGIEFVYKGKIIKDKTTTLREIGVKPEEERVKITVFESGKSRRQLSESNYMKDIIAGVDARRAAP
mmetsp:Transcript_19075/g.34631  ORF Transcript_19075/g.34631 Transcript_19075/m.34631 type:complete len:116 (+) Transcript_19075:345-692(+)